MKKALLFFPLLILFLGFAGSKVIDDKLKTLLQRFNQSDEYASNNIFYNISGPSFYIPNIKVLKDMAMGERAAMVEEIGKCVKNYTASDEFLKKYNEYRESRKPNPPEKPKSVSESKEEYRQSLQKSIEEMKKAKLTVAKDQQAMYDDLIKGFEQQLISIDDPDNSMFNPEMDTYSEQSYQMQMEQHNKELADWEKNYPINNPKNLIKKWIETFLNDSKDIDFNAQLKNDRGRQIFVNPAYERKSSQWKLYFRAGKEPVEVARRFAQSWLSELK